jgi:hypothetical protein
MPTFLVTVVDLLGVFVPGFVMLVAMLLVPSALGVHPRLVEVLPDPVGSNVWILGGTYAIAAYILGFLVRLVSIRIMNVLTLGRWADQIKAEAEALEPALTAAFANKQLTESLKKLAEDLNKYDPGRYAPYFHYAKRVVRREPAMWAEAERLEAEVRFAAGLFLPLVLLMLDGVLLSLWRQQTAGWWLFAAAGTGVVAVRWTFPSRRSREVLYDQFLALVVLSSPPATPHDKAEEQQPREAA